MTPKRRKSYDCSDCGGFFYLDDGGAFGRYSSTCSHCLRWRKTFKKVFIVLKTLSITN